MDGQCKTVDVGCRRGVTHHITLVDRVERERMRAEGDEPDGCVFQPLCADSSGMAWYAVRDRGYGGRQKLYEVAQFGVWDWAYPVSWADEPGVRAEIERRGGVVWCYDQSSVFGDPVYEDQAVQRWIAVVTLCARAQGIIN